MAQLVFGRDSQICFNSENDYYESLGFLAKNDGTTSLHWEHNEISGAWGSEGRIHCYKDLNMFPGSLSQAFTEGTGKILQRINCNEYVACLLNFHNFKLGDNQDVELIRNTVPSAYIDDFNNGLNL